MLASQATPVSTAEYPRACWNHRVPSKIVAKNAAHSRAATTLAAVNVRRRKTRRGTSGAGERRSTATKATSSATPSAANPIVADDSQPSSTVRLMAYTIAIRPAVTVTAPATSAGVRSEGRPPGTNSMTSPIRAAPMGTLTRKIHSHPGPSVNSPPAITPTVPAAPPTAPKMPSALFLAAPSVKVLVRIDRAAGAASAAPIPCTALAPTSCQRASDSPAASDAAANSARPLTSTRRRPNRSAARPPSSRNPPRARP